MNNKTNQISYSCLPCGPTANILSYTHSSMLSKVATLSKGTSRAFGYHFDIAGIAYSKPLLPARLRSIAEDFLPCIAHCVQSRDFSALIKHPFHKMLVTCEQHPESPTAQAAKKLFGEGIDMSCSHSTLGGKSPLVLRNGQWGTLRVSCAVMTGTEALEIFSPSLCSLGATDLSVLLRLLQKALRACPLNARTAFYLTNIFANLQRSSCTLPTKSLSDLTKDLKERLLVQDCPLSEATKPFWREMACTQDLSSLPDAFKSILPAVLKELPTHRAELLKSFIEENYPDDSTPDIADFYDEDLYN